MQCKSTFKTCKIVTTFKFQCFTKSLNFAGTFLTRVDLGSQLWTWRLYYSLSCLWSQQDPVYCRQRPRRAHHPIYLHTHLGGVIWTQELDRLFRFNQGMLYGQALVVQSYNRPLGALYDPISSRAAMKQLSLRSSCFIASLVVCSAKTSKYSLDFSNISWFLQRAQ